MGVEGQIEIRLGWRSGQIGQVRIESSRPVHASRLLEGKSIEQALPMLPRLFAICGIAQACAGVRACEQALGRQAVARDEALRDCLVNMETVSEHLWRIFLDWPVLLGEAPEQQLMASMMTIQKAYRELFTDDGKLFLLSENKAVTEVQVPLELLQKLGLILQQRVYGMPARDWLELAELSELQQWTSSGVTVAARLLWQIGERQWSGAGRCVVAALPALDLDQLHLLLEKDDFIERPQWLRNCCETSALTRTESPLLQSLQNLYGNGLLVRLVARLTELAQLAGRLFPDKLSSESTSPMSPWNPGIGQVSAARGQLLHRVGITGGCIVRYQILAPTEWNFHPQGVVAKSLAALSGTMEQIEQQAKWLINAIDPCVGYTLKIAEVA